MSAIANYLEEKILNHVLRGVASTSPVSLWLALYTTNPTDADTGVEVTGGSYARKQVVFTVPAQVSGKAETENTLDIEFAQATATWGTVTHIGVRDASTAGNLLFYGALQTPKYIETDDILRITAGELAITLD